jgi:hypothetical protein
MAEAGLGQRGIEVVSCEQLLTTSMINPFQPSIHYTQHSTPLAYLWPKPALVSVVSKLSASRFVVTVLSVVMPVSSEISAPSVPAGGRVGGWMDEDGWKKIRDGYKKVKDEWKKIGVDGSRLELDRKKLEINGRRLKMNGRRLDRRRLDIKATISHT